jgi:glutamate formiminotransferase/formiminotetrahydrofolate cyclodeaminase
MEVIKAMAEKGNPNSVSDAGVGVLCARSAVVGAYLNVKINAVGLTDADYKAKVLLEAINLKEQAINAELQILNLVEQKMA